MPRYRYRTAVLTGPWRNSRDEALADAERAQQVRIEEAEPHWLVPGWIEEGSAPAPARR